MYKTIGILVILLLSLGCLGNSGEIITRQPAVAGTFYPGDSNTLATMVQEHLENVGQPDAIDGQLIALIVPHAGLVYSGQIAAHSYALLRETTFDKLILCGGAHRFGFEGISVYGPKVMWKTPLGAVACDADLCNKLIAHSDRIQVLPQAHSREHSLEVQLPYIQMVLPDAVIVPTLIGYQDAAAVKTLSDALGAIKFDNRTLMIASTDWQHYKSAREGWPLDSLGIDCLKKFDLDRLETYLTNKRVEACGHGALLAVLKAAKAKGADRIKILKYGDSGDITGDKSSVVSYVAAAVYKANEAEKKSQSSSADNVPPYELSHEARTRLLEIARQSIEGYLDHGKAPTFDVSGLLKEPGAAFVTLNSNGRLRGCIGYTEARMPLNETVSHCAVQAAVSDPRFPPVTRDELDRLDIEISVLTPLQEVKSLDEIKVGRDGLMIFLGRSRGLLLPQVATEYGWTRTEFLEQTCRKARLPVDAYKNHDAQLYKFRALVFGEE